MIKFQTEIYNIPDIPDPIPLAKVYVTYDKILILFDIQNGNVETKTHIIQIPTNIDLLNEALKRCFTEKDITKIKNALVSDKLDSYNQTPMLGLDSTDIKTFCQLLKKGFSKNLLDQLMQKGGTILPTLFQYDAAIESMYKNKRIVEADYVVLKDMLVSLEESWNYRSCNPIEAFICHDCQHVFLADYNLSFNKMPSCPKCGYSDVEMYHDNDYFPLLPPELKAEMDAYNNFTGDYENRSITKNRMHYSKEGVPFVDASEIKFNLSDVLGRYMKEPEKNRDLINKVVNKKSDNAINLNRNSESMQGCCAKCGTPIIMGWNFCKKCGEKLVL